MVATNSAPATVVERAVPAGRLVDSPAATASIDSYLRSGESARGLAGVLVLVAAGMFVLVAVAWALGALPGAIRLF